MEDLLARTHKAAKLYMSLHEYQKKFEVPRDITAVNIDLLQRQSDEYVFFFFKFTILCFVSHCFIEVDEGHRCFEALILMIFFEKLRK